MYELNSGTNHQMTAVEEEKFASAEDEEEEDQLHADAKDEFFNDKWDFSVRNYTQYILQCPL